VEAARRQYDAVPDPAMIAKVTPARRRSRHRATICAGNLTGTREARVGPRRTLQLLLVLTALATLALALSGVVGPA
jgi:hypothetical protein